MAEIEIRIENLDSLKRNLRAAPRIAAKYLQRAITASTFEIMKQAIDTNFQFVTPRARRTGYLALSFNYGINIGQFRATVGPTANYAEYVELGTSRIHPNPFMERIAKAATDNIVQHFVDADDAIVEEIAKVS